VSKESNSGVGKKKEIYYLLIYPAGQVPTCGVGEMLWKHKMMYRDVKATVSQPIHSKMKK